MLPRAPDRSRDCVSYRISPPSASTVDLHLGIFVLHFRMLAILSLIALIHCFGLSPLRCNLLQGQTPEATQNDAGTKNLSPEQLDFFETKIRPVLVESCYECHSVASGESQSELLIDSATALRSGGSRGPALIEGKPQESLLLKAMQYGDSHLQMPPEGKLPDNVIADFHQWIEMGAPDPRSGNAPAKKSTPTQNDAASHWAYQPMAFATLPQQTSTNDLVDSIDIRIAERLKANQLTFSPQADRATLIRRLYFDLIGLPPNAEEVERFVDDSSSNAYENCVDRLLSSQHFGERWARHWMDLSRYADTKGYVFQEDRNYAAAYRYREWLIRAFNNDLPYDRFIAYQLAADHIDPQNSDGNLDAMGFLTLGRRFLNNQHDIIDDRIDVVSRGLMGLTVACARCHDHKYDPIPAADYYSLYGVFLNSHEPGGDPSPLRMADTPEQKPSFVLVRGAPWNRGAEVERRFLRFLSSNPETKFGPGSGRLDLAAAITSPSNPLTSRVLVNRIWLRLVGSSLIDSPSDLGLRCPPPVHQDVLDDLALGLIDKQWSIKSVIRRIALTRTYRQSSLAQNANAIAVDPENRLYWRMNRKRLDFEPLRDSMLVATGLLDHQIGGTSVAIHEPPFTQRRTVYAFIDRQNLPGIFRSFDMASPDSHSPQRSLTTVPQQGLFLLNSQWVTSIAEQYAQRLSAQTASGLPSNSEDSSFRSAIRALFRSILSRDPSENELAIALDFLKQAGEEHADTPQASWRYGYAHLDTTTNRLTQFTQLPTFDQGTWRGEHPLPDSKLGWVSLNARGGHPGEPGFAAVRRWTAPSDGRIRLRGRGEHNTDQGDGIRMTILANQEQLLGQWTFKNQKKNTPVQPLEVKAGDTIDFIVDGIGDVSHDGFQWEQTISYESKSSGVYDSKDHFSGPLPQGFSPWAQLTQALLSSNEFAFID